MAELTAQEQLILELINRARLDPLAEAARLGIDLNQGLAPGTLGGEQRQVLAHNALLNDASSAHSTWMLDTDTFSHTGSGGSDPGDRMRTAGYVFSGSWTWGENIAWTGTTGTLDVNAAAAQLHNNLFNSAGHRTNILGNFREIGIGAEAGQFTVPATPTTPARTYNALMVTEGFATSGTARFLTGVVITDSNGDDFYTIGEGRGGVSVATSLPSSTTSGAAGGYGLAVGTSGTVDVTFSGGGLAAAVSARVTLTGGNEKLDLLGSGEIASSATTVLLGGAHALRLLGLNAVNGTGNTLDNVITGNKGANLLLGGRGDDELNGGLGNDRFLWEAGADKMNGGDGIDSADYRRSAGATISLNPGAVNGAAAAGDTFAGIEYVYGSNTGADAISGSGAAERLWGFAGNDYLNGGAGIDLLYGGTGADTFDFDAGFGRDRIVDFEDGVDLIRIDTAIAAGLGGLAISGNGTTVVLVSSGADRITVTGLAPITLTAADFEFLA